MNHRKKLIEVALPLEAINAESAREKSIRHGHPSTLHLWWSRKPTAAARAVIWASLVDDPSAHPDKFPTAEAQRAERERLFEILTELIKWENSSNSEVLEKAKGEIAKSTGGNPPALLDPFAGGGSIPLEAQRLGLKVYAGDLNPVAVMINKAMVEIPPRFAGLPAVNPKSRAKPIDAWQGALGLAEDVKYYGEWMKEEAYKRIGHLYPSVHDEHGQERNVIAWIWYRTVKCPNPACGCELPLTSSFELSRKKGNEAYVEPVLSDGKIAYTVKRGKGAPQGTVTRSGARCIFCNAPVDFAYIRAEGQQGRLGAHLSAVVAEGDRQRLYISPDQEQRKAAQVPKPEDFPSGVLSGKCRVNVSLYGFDETADLFTNRQLTALTTFSELVAEAQARAEADALAAGMADDGISLAEGGAGAKAYGQAVGVYLAFLIDKLADYHSSFCSWNAPGEKMGHVFARQAIPMIWNYAEGNPFCSSSGSFTNMLDWVVKCVARLPCGPEGTARQFDAQSDAGLRDVMVSTDPPYYDNVTYSDLSDFFYVWMRQSLRDTYPDIFRTMLVPKGEELVANPYRFAGDKEQAREFFEQGMLEALRHVHTSAREDIPVTIYYAFKEGDIGGQQTSSSGWETMLSAIVNAGFMITGTWPMRTELSVRQLALGTNALASSIVLVCRKRSADVPICTRRDFINALRRELKPALDKLQTANIAPVDLAQSAIGPGMSVFSRYAKVLEADGSPMSVRSALQIINQELDLYFTEQDGELDPESRFCVDLYTQVAFDEVPFGEADVLARAKNTSVDALEKSGLVHAQKGKVRLLTRDEIPGDFPRNSVWLFTQQLTRAMEKEGAAGAARLVAGALPSEPERARALAYRLYTIAERQGWTQEAYAYNSLISMWRDIQSMAGELKSRAPEQTSLEF